MTSRHVYNDITEQLKLPEAIRLQGGIYVATKGMPTGVLLPTPKTGRAGYWPNIYLLLEYDNITLDLGRKTITAPRTIEMLTKQAAQVFNDVDKYIKFTIREDEGTLDAVVSQDELQDDLSAAKGETAAEYSDGRQGKKISENYPFIRHPRQEQDLIALFSMALARGLLPYEFLRISTTYGYDCYLRFKPFADRKSATIVGEFKLHGETILRDLYDAKVRYGQLQLLICWDLDEKKLRDAGFVVEDVKGSAKDVPGATHKVAFPISAGIRDQPIAVICMSQLLQVS